MPRSLIVSLYADELAFLWTVRRRAVRSYKYTLTSLAALDERLEAHRDGLRLAGDEGWAACQQGLENAAGGELFALTLLAFESGDRARMSQAVTAAAVSDDAREGLVTALAWLGPDLVQPWLLRLMQAGDTWQRATALEAAARRGDDPGAVLDQALEAAEAPVRAAALRAVGALKRGDLLGRLQGKLDDEDQACRFEAARALTLLNPSAGLRHLTRWTETDDERGRLALETCFRAISLEEGKAWIRTMAQEPAWRRRAVIAVGVLGDPTSLPWLVIQMQTPALARVAGEAFTAITGVDIDAEGLDVDVPADDAGAAGSADDLSEPVQSIDEPDADLVIPSAEKVAEWWREQQGEFRGGVRYLAGRPVDVPSLRELMRHGRQPLRSAAALQLTLLDYEAPCFDVGARATFQRQLLDVGR